VTCRRKCMAASLRPVMSATRKLSIRPCGRPTVE
jgi:hypothetical protein